MEKSKQRTGREKTSRLKERQILKFITFAACLALTINLNAQNILTGKVTDKSQEPLIGASISIEGQPGKGTITDINGHYELQLPKNTKH